MNIHKLLVLDAEFSDLIILGVDFPSLTYKETYFYSQYFFFNFILTVMSEMLLCLLFYSNKYGDVNNYLGPPIYTFKITHLLLYVSYLQPPPPTSPHIYPMNHITSSL